MSIAHGLASAINQQQAAERYQQSGLGTQLSTPTPRAIPVIENLTSELTSLYHALNNHVYAMNELHRRLTGSSALGPQEGSPEQANGEKRSHFDMLHETIHRYRQLNNDMHTIIEELQKQV